MAPRQHLGSRFRHSKAGNQVGCSAGSLVEFQQEIISSFGSGGVFAKKLKPFPNQGFKLVKGERVKRKEWSGF